MLLRLLRTWLWHYQRSCAEWDSAHYWSGVTYYTALAKKADRRVRALDAVRAEVEYPSPRGVTR